jgi:hypothetical protein
VTEELVGAVDEVNDHFGSMLSSRISLTRSSFSVGARSMKITEDVRECAAEQGISGEAAVEKGMQEKGCRVRCCRRRLPESLMHILANTSSDENASRLCAQL